MVFIDAKSGNKANFFAKYHQFQKEAYFYPPFAIFRY